jgi:hypothetical protein
MGAEKRHGRFTGESPDTHGSLTGDNFEPSGGPSNLRGISSYYSPAPGQPPRLLACVGDRLPVEKFAASMTHDILQTDIDLATRLRDDQRPDEEIILALAHRGVDAAKAAELVDNLRNGRAPTPQPLIPPEFARLRRSRSRNVARETGQSPPTRPAPAASRVERQAQPAIQGRKKSVVLWLAAVALVGLAIAVVALVLSRNH